MLEEKLNRKLQQRFGEQVRATVEGDIIRVTGHLQCWEDIPEACNMCVVKQPGVHVVNDVVLDGVEMPQLDQAERAGNLEENLQISVVEWVSDL